ncbi:MAG TPA: hypothetical protein VFW28_10115 [Micropepsaceae bacterium]|nr:hypothetical protein [Micropepsaceae bacterium]
MSEAPKRHSLNNQKIIIVKPCGTDREVPSRHTPQDGIFRVMVVFGLIDLAVTVLCVIWAGRMAGSRARSQRGWMFAAAMLGPIPLAVLAALPVRGGVHR